MDYLSEERKQLRRDIEAKREELCDKIEAYGLNSDIVKKCSEELDQMINQLMVFLKFED